MATAVALLMFRSPFVRVSVHVMGSTSSFGSCDQAEQSGWTGNALFFAWFVRLASGRIRLGRSWGLTPCSFLAVNIEQGA